MHLPLPENPILVPTDLYMKSRNGDWVYMCENASQSSYSGCVDTDCEITEPQIANFIEWSNPELFKKLGGMPVASSHVLEDGEADKNAAVEDWADEGIEADAEEPTTMSVQNRIQTAAVQNSKSSLLTDDHALQQEASEGHHDMRLKSFVLDGQHAFTVHEHTDASDTYFCSYTTCQRPMYIIPYGELFASMNDERWNTKDLPRGRPKTIHFCFDCLQEALRQELRDGRDNQIMDCLVDGSCDRESVLGAVEKIHPPLKPRQLFFVYLPQGPTLEPGTGSNSTLGLRRRRQKQYEIVKILQAIQVEHKVKTSKLQDQEEADLRIHPLSKFEPFRERYKKQGLQWNDMDHLKGHSCADTSKIDARSSPEVEEVFAGDCHATTCHCQQILVHEKMVSCSSKSCMYGWIHLRCSGLTEMPRTSDGFICQDCRKREAFCSKEESSCDGSDYEEGTSRRSSGVQTSEGYAASVSGSEVSSNDEEEVENDTEMSDTKPKGCGWVAVNDSIQSGMRCETSPLN
ncbi:hypothetical protein H2202_001622 [Exophiala xenobiotica]|nr:hypothetical protein H2202_001622 [Exophiala xenobiotica]